MESFVFGPSFEEDLEIGFGTVAGVTLPDGSVETLNKIGIHSFLGLAYVSAQDFPGADASAKIKAAIAALPSTGGAVDARALYGNQTWSIDPFAGLSSTKPIHLFLGSGTTTVTLDCTIPLNVATSFSTGSILSMSGFTLTIFGQIIADLFKIFAGTTVPALSSPLQAIYPQWFGAVGDGTTDDWPAAQAGEDAIISGSALNTVEIAPAGVLLFPSGTYLFSQPLSTCHFNGCPGDVGRGIPAGSINACITIKGDSRGVAQILTNTNIDNIQMFNWACPSSVEDLMLTASAQDASHAAIRVRGNLTTVKNNWMLSSIGVLVESTGPSANGLDLDAAGTKILHNQCDWINSGGGVVNCVYITKTAGSDLAPQGLTIADLDCYGGNLCITADHLYKSVISDIRSNHGGQGIINFVAATSGDIDSIAISNVVGDGTALTVQATEFGINLSNATNIEINNFIARDYQGQALIARESSGSLSNFAFLNNVQNAAIGLPYDIYAANSDFVLKGGSITNDTGFPTEAIRVEGAGGSGPSGSYVIDGVLITGTQYTGTVIHGETGSGGMRSLKITNNELRDINTGGAASTIIVNAAISLIVTNNYITDTGSPTNWLETQYLNTTTCLGHNVVNGAENISLNGTAFGGYTDGCFGGADGATPVTQSVVGHLDNRGALFNSGAASFGSTVTIDGTARITGAQLMTDGGSDTVAANNLTLPSNGNFPKITGNTQINCIATSNWGGRATVTLFLTGTPTLKQGQVCGAGFGQLLLDGSADWTATVNSNITLGLIDGVWTQLSRKQA